MTDVTSDATEPIDLLVEVTAGSVRITAERTQTVTVDVRSTRSGQRGDELADEVQVDFADGRLEIVEPPRMHSWSHSYGRIPTAVSTCRSRCPLDRIAG